MHRFIIWMPLYIQWKSIIFCNLASSPEFDGYNHTQIGSLLHKFTLTQWINNLSYAEVSYIVLSYNSLFFSSSQLPGMVDILNAKSSNYDH